MGSSKVARLAMKERSTLIYRGHCWPAPRALVASSDARADCGNATPAVAEATALPFVPLMWERFDLALRQRDYFLPGPRPCSSSCARRPPSMSELRNLAAMKWAKPAACGW